MVSEDSQELEIGLRWFIVLRNPGDLRLEARRREVAPSAISRTISANRTKSSRFDVLSGCASKNGTIVRSRSPRDLTCSGTGLPGGHRDDRCGRHGRIRRTDPARRALARFRSLLEHLKVGVQLPPQATTTVPDDRNTEAAFAVDEPDNPHRIESRPFPADFPHSSDCHCPLPTSYEEGVTMN